MRRSRFGLPLVLLLALGLLSLFHPGPATAQARVCATSVTTVPGSGGSSTLDPRLRNNSPAGLVQATGEPDATVSLRYVSLGFGGSLTATLASPGVSTDGTANSDLFVYENGTLAEFVFVSISTDGVTFIDIGLTGSQNAGIDLDAIPGVTPGIASITRSSA